VGEDISNLKPERRDTLREYYILDKRIEKLQHMIRKTTGVTKRRERLVMTQKAFDRLLVWLDSDPDLAGEKYLVIRRGLAQFFERRGCNELDDLADKTIDRVIKKLPEIADKYTGEQAKYFYGVARHVYQEYLRRPQVVFSKIEPEDSIVQERKDRCRQKCLDKLPDEDRRLITDYYLKERQERIEYRRKLAIQYGLTSNALTVKAFRIRSALNRCLGECLQLLSD
jgi:DNA-directed RNA polymerase specialized sigma24 family protein